MKNKKAQVGLNTVGIVITWLLILGVLVIATFLALNSLSEVSILGATGTTAYTTTNESNAWINNTGYTVTDKNDSTGTFAITEVWNATTAGAGVYNYSLGAGNYTIDATTGVITNASASLYENVSVTYTWVYTYNSDTGNLVDNVTTGTTDFFSNVPTFMTLLAVAVILLIIGLVIFAVNRFSGGAKL